MLKNINLLLCISLCSMTLLPIEPTLPEADTVIHVHIENKQEANNTVNLNKPTKKPVRCTLVLGDKLKECVHSLKKIKQKKLLAKFSKHHRTAYIKTLSKEEYEHFLDSFTENEWQLFFAQLSESEKKQWPKTIKEQKTKLNEIKEIVNGSLLDLAPKAVLALGLSVFMLYSNSPMCILPIIDLAKNGSGTDDIEEIKIKKYIDEKFG